MCDCYMCACVLILILLNYYICVCVHEGECLYMCVQESSANACVVHVYSTCGECLCTRVCGKRCNDMPWKAVGEETGRVHRHTAIGA